MKQTARIENWYIIHGVMIGNVFDHPKFEDGTVIRTSTIVEQTSTHIETWNTIYTLGDKIQGMYNEFPEQQA